MASTNPAAKRGHSGREVHGDAAGRAHLDLLVPDNPTGAAERALLQTPCSSFPGGLPDLNDLTDEETARSPKPLQTTGFLLRMLRPSRV